MRQNLWFFVLAACAACGSDEDPNGSGSSSGSSSGASPNSGPFGGIVDSGSPSTNCTPNLTGLVRDFKGTNVAGGHPDFEAFTADDPTTQLVAAKLGADRKPVFASTTGDGKHGKQLSGKAEFDQWYRNTEGVNQAFEFVLPLKSGPNGVATFASSAFFPIDGKGFGNSGKDEGGAEHNFHFTFELHLEFVYRGGESFTFTGDDDLWAFFNGTLGIDLGGLHPARTATVKLDDAAGRLGITKGKTYPLDVFHAERHTNASNFRIDTTFQFVNCGAIILPK